MGGWGGGGGGGGGSPHSNNILVFILESSIARQDPRHSHDREYLT